MKHKFFSRMFSTLIAMVIAVVSLTFLSAQKVSAAGLNLAMSYLSYNFKTKETQSYVLSRLPMASSNSRESYKENRYPDTDKSVVYLNINGDRGTGFIVGAHCIATAAHCVYNDENGKFADSIQVIICENNARSPIAKYDAVSAHIPKKYTKTKGAEMTAHDYGMICVEEDLSQYGIFNLGVPMDSFLENNGKVIASGFPGSIAENGEQVGKSSRYYSEGVMQKYYFQPDINEYAGTISRRFQASCVVSGGDSGGPVYTVTKLNGKSYKTVLGIATGGNTLSASGVYDGTYGVRMTPTLLHFYMNNDYA